MPQHHTVAVTDPDDPGHVVFIQWTSNSVTLASELRAVLHRVLTDWLGANGKPFTLMDLPDEPQRELREQLIAHDVHAFEITFTDSSKADPTWTVDASLDAAHREPDRPTPAFVVIEKVAGEITQVTPFTSSRGAVSHAAFVANNNGYVCANDLPDEENPAPSSADWWAHGQPGTGVCAFNLTTQQYLPQGDADA